MNSITLFSQNAHLHPEKMAIADIKHGILTFKEILDLSSKVQDLMRKKHIKTGDSVLVAITPSPFLYSVLCGLMGMGIRIVFIEPWLDLDRINHVIRDTAPKAFITSFIGKVWGVRSEGIRKIPHWLTPSDIRHAHISHFEVIDLEAEHHAFVVFSSGTMGPPKGVIRTHQYMQNIYETFTALEPQTWTSPDFIIFPNVALFHLATGRGSVIVPQKWNKKKFNKLFKLFETFRPETLSTGPAFLKTLLDLEMIQRLKSLDRLVIGGALTDCWLLEKAFEELPDTRFMHIYGGSEAEPVALMDAKEAVKLSREKGFFQTLCLGKKIPQIKYKLKNEILWVSGPNVAGEYIGHQDENKGIKEKDSEGNLWHCMGDRIEEDQGFFWFMGRQSQKKEDFLLEQKIYTYLQSSQCFLHRTSQDKLLLIGEKLKIKKTELKKEFPQLEKIIESQIYRDKRHRSRIDRKRSLTKIKE